MVPLADVEAARIPPPPRDVPLLPYLDDTDDTPWGLDLTLSAITLERKVRAFNPWPVAEAEVAGEPLRIWMAHAVTFDHDAAPGSVLGASRDGFDLACGDGVLRITALQRAGGKRITAADFLNARPELRAAR